MLIRRQSARVKKSGRFSKIGGLLASVPSISRPNFRAACLRKIVWELFFRTGTLASQASGRAGLHLDFHFKITLIPIDERFGGRDKKFHWIDPRGHGSQLSELDPQHGRIGLGDLEHLKFVARDLRR